MRAKVTSFLACLFLLGCESAGDVAPSDAERPKSIGSFSNVAMKSFTSRAKSSKVFRANTDIANEFLDLNFKLESGADLRVMTRFEGPVTVAFTRSAPSYAQRDLKKLVSRLRKEAGINITMKPAGSKASITIDRISPAQLSAVVPNAACFVIPNVANLRELKKARRAPRVDWGRIVRRTQATVFMPDNIPPQEIRDCLHEEIAQALGPLNDLYRAPDSVYNDDNFHSALTPYDMLILRALYAPELKTGQTRSEVRARIFTLIDRLNPSGRGYAIKDAVSTPRSWVDLIETALGPSSSYATRINSIDRAIAQARGGRMNDHRLGFAQYARGRLRSGKDPEAAANDYFRAYALFKKLFGDDDIHTAKVSVQMASLAFSAGNLNTARDFIQSAVPAAKRAENATLLFKLLAIEAEIEDFEGNKSKAKSIRKEAIGWGKYGLGKAEKISRVLQLVSELRPGTGS